MKNVLAIGLFVLATSNLFAQKTISQPSAILKGHTNDVTKVAVSNKLNLIATGSWDKTINIYDTSYAIIKTLSGHTFPITALAFRPDGRMLASGSSDNTIILWDSIWRISKTLEGHKDQINALLLERSNRFIFSGSEDKTVKVWSITSGKPFRSIEVGHGVTSLAQTNDSRFIYVASANPQIRQYNLTNLTIARTFDGHADIVNAIAISPNNKLMLTGSNDKTARIWDLVTGKQIRVLPVSCWKVTAVAFSDDSKYAITGCNDGSVKIWEVENGKLIAQIEANGHYIKDVAFTKDNFNILVAAMLKGSTEFGLRVWSSGIEKPVIMTKNISDSLETPKPEKQLPIPVQKKRTR